MKYKELLAKVGEGGLKYQELLETLEWRNKRIDILARDKFYCTQCGNSASTFEYGELSATNKYDIRSYWYGDEIIEVYEPFNPDKKISLHVHHKFYVLGKLPWEYKEDDLVTLCDSCHWKLHQQEKVKIYSSVDNGLVEIDYHVCDRCNGAGVFPEYSHVQKGLCFKCNGAKYQELIDKPVVIGYV